MYIIMKLLIIIYIFACFVLFSPNIFFKSSKNSNIYYAVLFSLFLYFSSYVLEFTLKEGAMLNAYDMYGNQEKIHVNNIHLEDAKLPDDYSSLNQKDRIIYKEPEKNDNPDIVMKPMGARQHKLEIDIANLMKHDHESPYKQDLKNHYCAANYNEVTPCCGQKDTYVPDENICPKYRPLCYGYVANEKWGKCIKDPNMIPNLKYNEEPNTEWDGDITGEYVLENKIVKGNYQPEYHVTIEKSGNNYIWKDKTYNKWVLERISNTNDFKVIGGSYLNWTLSKVILDNNFEVLYITGPKEEVFTKQK